MTTESSYSNTRHKLSCDQTAWLNQSLEAFRESIIRNNNSPSPRYKHDSAAQLATLLEIMDILYYEFADNEARENALSNLKHYSQL